MLFADDDEAVTLGRPQFVIRGHTLLPETHPHRLLTHAAITRSLSRHLLTRGLASVLSLRPRVVGEDVLALR